MPIRNRQLTSGNQETHPVPRGGTDFIVLAPSFLATHSRSTTRLVSVFTAVQPRFCSQLKEARGGEGGLAPAAFATFLAIPSLPLAVRFR